MGTIDMMSREEYKLREIVSIRVSMHIDGADWPVVVMKFL